MPARGPGQKAKRRGVEYDADTPRCQICKHYRKTHQGVGSYDPAASIANQNIATGRVGPGMTPRQVRASWGAPHKINSSLHASGSTEQWIYYRDEQHIRAQYVHFSNGVVSSVSD